MLPLPESTNEYWNDHEKSIVDLSTVSNSICEQCIYVYDNDRREIQCQQCGKGYRVRGGDIVEDNGKYIFRNKIISLINGQEDTTNTINSKKKQA